MDGGSCKVSPDHFGRLVPLAMACPPAGYDSLRKCSILPCRPAVRHWAVDAGLPPTPSSLQASSREGLHLELSNFSAETASSPPLCLCHFWSRERIACCSLDPVAGSPLTPLRLQAGSREALHQEWVALSGQNQAKRTEADMLSGAIQTLLMNVERAQQGLAAPNLQDIDKKFMHKQVEVETTRMAVNDLDKYHKVGMICLLW